MAGRISEQGFVNVGGGAQLHYEVRGTGPHTLLCIPGALGTSHQFIPQFDYFGKEGSDFKLVAFDPRGHGSSRPAKRYEENTNFLISDAEDANALMQALSLPEYSVLGWCNGGIAALVLAAMYPKSVQKLVVWGANAFVTKEDIELFENIRYVDTWNPEIRDSLLRIYGNSSQELWSEWLDNYTAFLHRNDGDICKNYLSKIICPTLVIHGARDSLLSSIHPAYLRDHVIGSQLEIIEKGGHDPHLRHCQEFNKIVEKFLEA